MVRKAFFDIGYDLRKGGIDAFDENLGFLLAEKVSWPSLCCCNMLDAAVSNAFFGRKKTALNLSKRKDLKILNY